VVPDALNRGRSSAAEPFGQETSREGRWCNKSGRNIFLDGDGIYTNCYYELRCVFSPYSLQVAIQLNGLLC